MAKVTQVDKRLTVSNWNGIRFQVLIYCFTRNIKIADGELECLSLLARYGNTELNTFCEHVARTTPEGLPAAKDNTGAWQGKRIYASPQVARNSLAKLESKGLVIKDGRNKKTVQLNPEIKVVSSGNVFLNYQIMALATEEI